MLLQTFSISFCIIANFRAFFIRHRKLSQEKEEISMMAFFFWQKVLQKTNINLQPLKTDTQQTKLRQITNYPIWLTFVQCQ